MTSTNAFLVLLSPTLWGPFYGILGHRCLLISGSTLFFISLLVLSFFEGGECGNSFMYFVILLSWGFGCGTGAGTVFSAATSFIGNRSDKARGLAYGLVFAGSSVGGVIWPLMLQTTLEKSGTCARDFKMAAMLISLAELAWVLDLQWRQLEASLVRTQSSLSQWHHF